MFFPPAVTVHGLDDARAALALGKPVTLLSAPGAALAGGCAWWQAVITAARASFPHAEMADILDCADAPGRAMAALRIGLKAIVLHPACPAFAAVASAAAAVDAVILPTRPAEYSLNAWLRSIEAT